MIKLFQNFITTENTIFYISHYVQRQNNYYLQWKFNSASEVSIDNNEAFEKQIIEKLKQKKDCPSDNPLILMKKSH